MKVFIRNIISFIFTVFIGSVINMMLIELGNYLFPIKGIDPNDIDAYIKIVPSLNAEFFLFPFLAHAIGTFLASFLCVLIAFNHKLKLSIIIGVLFLSGGIYMSIIIPAPFWFIFIDLIFAYIPMALLAWKTATVILNKNRT
ncbi:MAG: hypothetical protein CL824_06175 [Crocinitomicaceae bacterium]|nr:hypothetical protein [Crocinitomicaceae bacterium]